MSENLMNSKIIKDKPRSKKLNPRIDLSAMVSISFLLIIFFMLNAELSKPQVMNLRFPSCRELNDFENYGCIKPDERRVITLLLDDNNKIIYFHGLLSTPIESPKTLNYGKDGIRKKLLSINNQIKKLTGDSIRGTTVIIKPSKKSTYGNLVDILDEVAINNIQTYTVVNDITPDEYKLLASR